jgi:hypothetical protein
VSIDAFAERTGIPVAETMAGKAFHYATCLTGAVGVTGIRRQSARGDLEIGIAPLHRSYLSKPPSSPDKTNLLISRLMYNQGLPLTVARRRSSLDGSLSGSRCGCVHVSGAGCQIGRQ